MGDRAEARRRCVFSAENIKFDLVGWKVLFYFAGAWHDRGSYGASGCTKRNVGCIASSSAGEPMEVAAVEMYAAGNIGASDATTQPVEGGTGCGGILARWGVVEGGVARSGLKRAEKK